MTSLREPTPLAGLRADGARTPVPGAASFALRPLLSGPRRCARVIAVFPSAVYLEYRSPAEPKVIALVSSDATRLPNAVVVAARSRELPFGPVRQGDEAWIGDASLEIPALRVRVRRWWDPSPVLGPISAVRLAHGAAALKTGSSQAPFGLAGHPGPVRLAERCAAGDLAQAVDAAERIVGLGPGLTPSGDDVLAGLVSAVLRAIAGQEPMAPALRRLLGAGHTSGADLAWGVLAGCRATLALSGAAAQSRRATA